MIVVCFSISNNNGHTPVQVAIMCGYEECGKYLAEAARRQEAEAKGVYQKEKPHPCAITTPSPHDITTKGAGLPVANGINGHCFQDSIPNGHSQSEEVAMEEDGMDTVCGGDSTTSHESVPHAANPFGDGPPTTEQPGSLFGGVTFSNGHFQLSINTDITLNQGISSNVVPVGGRKRSREGGNDMEFKRRKKTGGYTS